MSAGELARGRELDALIDVRLYGTASRTPAHFSTALAASLLLESELQTRGWTRSYARDRDEPRTLVRLVHRDGRRAEAAGLDPIVNLCHAALQALGPPPPHAEPAA